MTAEYFLKLYDYHFTLNRRVWDVSIATLTEAQFLQHLPYSIGSMRDQTVHMMDVDQGWLRGLRDGPSRPDFIDPNQFPNKASVRAAWDKSEAELRGILKALTDECLDEIYFAEVKVWEVLFHVLNHGTDHRAQVLAMLHTLNAPTFPQDYIYFAQGRVVGVGE